MNNDFCHIIKRNNKILVFSLKAGIVKFDYCCLCFFSQLPPFIKKKCLQQKAVFFLLQDLMKTLSNIKIAKS